MITFGFSKGFRYTNDGTLQIQVRVPSIHGPYKQTANTKAIYTRDEDLPFYTSVLLNNMPTEGEVVMLQSTSEGVGADFVVVGVTGGSYYTGTELT